MDIIIPENPDEAGRVHEAQPPSGVDQLIAIFDEIDVADEAYVILQCCASHIPPSDMCISRAAELLESSPESVRLAGAALGRCIDMGAAASDDYSSIDELRDVYAEASSLVMTGWRP